MYVSEEKIITVGSIEDEQEENPIKKGRNNNNCDEEDRHITDEESAQITTVYVD